MNHKIFEYDPSLRQFEADFDFGGFGRIHHDTYQAQLIDGGYAIQVYLPSRTAMVLKKV